MNDEKSSFSKIDGDFFLSGYIAHATGLPRIESLFFKGIEQVARRDALGGVPYGD